MIPEEVFIYSHKFLEGRWHVGGFGGQSKSLTIGPELHCHLLEVMKMAINTTVARDGGQPHQ